jgi:hypothetical protein
MGDMFCKVTTKRLPQFDYFYRWQVLSNTIFGYVRA